MSSHYDFKKEWDKTRVKLEKFSKEAVQVAKKGEKEFVEFSRKSKLHIDATAINLRKERLYYMIGKEFAQGKEVETSNPKLKKLLTELSKANRQQVVLKRKLNVKKKNSK